MTADDARRLVRLAAQKRQRRFTADQFESSQPAQPIDCPRPPQARPTPSQPSGSGEARESTTWF
ncbi:MAG: hypothetical protein IPJ65_28675 [Archangiaceae bacterium]|nr:hypothetical protein [Archangiaceae bacterium]